MIRTALSELNFSKRYLWEFMGLSFHIQKYLIDKLCCDIQKSTLKIDSQKES